MAETDNCSLPMDVLRAVVSIAAMRTKFGLSFSEEDKNFAQSEINKILIKYPELSTHRSAAIFLDGHVEIGLDITERHTVLHARRCSVCKEQGVRPPAGMISGEYFEFDGKKFLKLDVGFPDLIRGNTTKKLSAEGYTILTPDYSVQN